MMMMIIIKGNKSVKSCVCLLCDCRTSSYCCTFIITLQSLHVSCAMTRLIKFTFFLSFPSLSYPLLCVRWCKNRNRTPRGELVRCARMSSYATLGCTVHGAWGYPISIWFHEMRTMSVISTRFDILAPSSPPTITLLLVWASNKLLVTRSLTRSHSLALIFHVSWGIL